MPIEYHRVSSWMCVRVCDAKGMQSVCIDEPPHACTAYITLSVYPPSGLELMTSSFANSQPTLKRRRIA
jgi:hypothetical protein